MNRIGLIIELLDHGVDPKDAPKIAEQQLKDRAGFFAKLKVAQAEMETIVTNLKNSFTNKDYASVDQFVAKGRLALNEAGLTMYAAESREICKGVPDGNGIEKPEKHWETTFTIGDSGTGYREGILFCLPVGKEQELGKTDSYALKYMMRSTMMAERADNDPDKKDDIDANQYQSKQRSAGAKKRTKPAPVPKSTMKAKAKPKPKPKKEESRAAVKNGTRDKPTKKQMDARIKRAKERLGVCKQELKEAAMKSILREAGFVAAGFKTVDDFEAAAELLESRIVFDRLSIKLTDRLGQPAVDELLIDFEDVNNVEVLKAGIPILADKLNSKQTEAQH